MLRFEWNVSKAKSNLKKHSISFEEAETSFSDPKALIIPDPEHSIEEERLILLGLSSNLRFLVVVHCYRENDAVIRIISARKASKIERKVYEEKL
jgi:hypothetical protein